MAGFNKTQAEVHYKWLQDNAIMQSVFVDKIIKNLPAEGKILDIAAGSGVLSIPMAEAGYDVTSTDYSIEQLKILNRRKTNSCNEKVQNISIHFADAKNLPFEDDTFDAVTAKGFIQMFADPFGFITEMVKKVKNGGVVIFNYFNSDYLSKLEISNEEIKDIPTINGWAKNSISRHRLIEFAESRECVLRRIVPAALVNYDIPFYREVYRKYQDQNLFKHFRDLHDLQYNVGSASKYISKFERDGLDDIPYDDSFSCIAVIEKL